ncbi:MAG: bactofilin family protein [Pseudomonadales bacterium]
MWWFKKHNGLRAAGGLITLIAQSTEIEGNVRFLGNMEVEGVVNGNLFALDQDVGTMRIMENGCVQGDVHVPNVIVNGRVVGDVHASKYLELASNAVVEGNVYYNILEMVRGAQINGKLIYTEEDSYAELRRSAEEPVPDAAAVSVSDSVVEIKGAS